MNSIFGWSTIFFEFAWKQPSIRYAANPYHLSRAQSRPDGPAPKTTFYLMADSPSSLLVEFKELTFSYPGSSGDRVILDRVTLAVPRGK
jgi:hypothetical protein